MRGLIAAGETPTSMATKQTEVATVAELGQRYLGEYAIPHKKPSGIAQDRQNLQNHVVPLMGKLRVTTVERADVARAMREVAAGNTAKDEKAKHQGRQIVRGGEIVANRVQALLSKMFTLGKRCAAPTLWCARALLMSLRHDDGRGQHGGNRD